MTLPKPARAPKARKPLARKTPLKRTAAPRKSPPKKRAPSIKTLREKADRLFSEYIRARDGRCITCSTTEALQCSHFYGKKARPAVRYDPMNAHAQCARCHLAHHKHDPGKYMDWMRQHYSEDELDALQYRSHGIAKRDRAYFLEVIHRLEAHRALG